MRADSHRNDTDAGLIQRNITPGIDDNRTDWECGQHEVSMLGTDQKDMRSPTGNVGGGIYMRIVHEHGMTTLFQDCLKQ